MKSVGSIVEMFNFKLFTLGLFLMMTSAFATTESSDVVTSSYRLKNFFSADIYTGPTMVSGQFSNQKNPNSYGFALNVFFQPIDQVPFPSYMSIGNYNFSMVSNDSSYPFPVGQEVLFSSTYMNLMVSVYSTHNWGLYLGVGYSLISLFNDKDTKNLQNYGSQQYELQARYKLNDRWGLNYRTKWSQINQYQNGNFSFIELWTHLLGISYLVF